MIQILKYFKVLKLRDPDTVTPQSDAEPMLIPAGPKRVTRRYPLCLTFPGNIAHKRGVVGMAPPVLSSNAKLRCVCFSKVTNCLPAGESISHWARTF